MQQKPQHVFTTTGAISLLLLPALLMIAFALHYTTFSDFFSFRLTKEPYDAHRLVETLSTADGGFRQYTLPHLFGYLALPLFISAAIFLARKLWTKTPWHAIIGSALTIIGTVFLGGVFGAWLSFAAVTQVPAGEAPHVLPVLTALTTMQGPLLLSSALSALTFLGMIVLGAGLYKSGLVPKWSALAFILGNLLILVFIDLDNWMFIGALLLFIGMLPLSMRMIHAQPS